MSQDEMYAEVTNVASLEEEYWFYQTLLDQVATEYNRTPHWHHKCMLLASRLTGLTGLREWQRRMDKHYDAEQA